jgi:phosphatidate phosphatase APP1
MEDKWVNHRNFRLVKRGYYPHIIGYQSIGNLRQVLVQLRVILVKDQQKTNLMRRGLLSFRTKQAPHARVNIWLGNCPTALNLETDRGGYITKLVDCKLEPGWSDIRIELADGYQVQYKQERIYAQLPPKNPKFEGKVLVIDNCSATGIVSDIDDTILVSHAPSALIALRNILFASPYRRKAVPGMANFYRGLAEKIPNSFLVYLSASPWNQFTFLKHFILANKYPWGALVLQDIGPDDTKIFESTRSHKVKKLEELFSMFPETKWVLIGDDGQYDVEIYKRMALLYPDRIKAILIRQLSVPRRILVTPLPNLIPTPTRVPKSQIVPIIYATNGFEFEQLAAQFLTNLDQS